MSGLSILSYCRDVVVQNGGLPRGAPPPSVKAWLYGDKNKFQMTDYMIL